MGWAKTDEDIRERIDVRMRDNGRSYYGNTYINRSPDYLSRGSASYYPSTHRYTPPSTYRPTPISTYKPVVSTYRPSIVTVPVITPKKDPPKPTPAKRTIGYIERDYEHYGIEIYFYQRPDESVLDELKENGWHWHRQKSCWFKKNFSSNKRFAERIIKQ